MKKVTGYQRFTLLSTLLCLLMANGVAAQQRSENGWVLPTKGTVRVLVAFVEIDHDENSDKDAYPDGSDMWKVNELPEYKDDIFNAFEGEDSLKMLTKYYDESSFGQFVVLGDYFPEIITLKQSEVGTNKTKVLRKVVERLNSAERLSSRGLGFEDFDHWQDSPKRGIPKVPAEEFSGVDHLMIFLRNFSRIPGGNGQASGSSGGVLNGQKSDSYSIFGGGGGLPFKILKHEFNHLLIGGNNFHSGGGNSAGFRSYVPAVQGGWSMMGAANSSLLTAAAWDRYWLGWKPEGSEHEIRALDESGVEVNTDLLPFKGKRVFVLRDFVATGDAIRMELPHIPEDEFPQWIWLENHTTSSNNRSDFDRFSYEHYDCIEKAVPGLFSVRQIDADQKEGASIYSGVYADYLKPIPATGAYDYVWEDEKRKLDYCVNSTAYYPYIRLPGLENPMTGYHEMESPFFYDNGDIKLDMENSRSPGMRRNPDGTYQRHPRLGDPAFAFREEGNSFIGIGTNPSSASTITHVNTRKGRSTHKQNSDAVYLNGISIKILETLPDFALKIQVSFTDTLIDEPRRWAGSDIVLSDHNPGGADLVVSSELKLNRGKTLTRFVEPDTVNGEVYFTSPTVLRVKDGARMRLEGKAFVVDDSQIVIENGGTLELSRKSKMVLEDFGQIIIEKGGVITGRGKIKIKDGANALGSGDEAVKKLKKLTCNKKKVRAIPSGSKP